MKMIQTHYLNLSGATVLAAPEGAEVLGIGLSDNQPYAILHVDTQRPMASLTIEGVLSFIETDLNPQHYIGSVTETGLVVHYFLRK